MSAGDASEGSVNMLYEFFLTPNTLVPQALDLCDILYKLTLSHRNITSHRPYPQQPHPHQTSLSVATDQACEATKQSNGDHANQSHDDDQLASQNSEKEAEGSK